MLKPYCTDWNDRKAQMLEKVATDIKEVPIIIARMDALYDDIIKEFPKKVNAKLLMSEISKTWIYANIYLDEKTSIADTTIAKKFLVSRYHKITRSFNTANGDFTWNGEVNRKDEKGTYREQMCIQNTDPGKCKVIKYKETVTRYKTDCKKVENESTK